MEIVESPQINSFAKVRSDRNQSDRHQSDLTGSNQAGSPAEDIVFVLTSAQLQSIVTRAIQDVTGTVMDITGTFTDVTETVLNVTVTIQSERDKDLIAEAIQPLQDRISSLEERLVSLEEENTSMRLKMASLETTEEQDISRLACDIAYDRQRISKLESKPTGPAPTAPPQGEKTLARIAKIDEVLKARGATTLKQLEHILGIDRATMTRLLGKLDMRRYDLHARPGDAREKVLRLRAQIR
jgi:hypothetical protein